MTEPADSVCPSNGGIPMDNQTGQPTESIGPIVAVCLLLTIVLSGCAAAALNRFKQHAERGDYQWIANQAIACTHGSAACSQLHLIKGEACLHLAESGQTPAAHYRCDADELAAGLDLSRSRPDTAVQQRFQEYLCESLSNLQAHQADETASKYVEAAQALYQLAPASVPAVYYLSHARLRQVLPELPDLAVYDRLPVCHRLKRTLVTVLTTMEAAKRAGSEDWQRFAGRYERLAFDLGAAIGTAQCR